MCMESVLSQWKTRVLTDQENALSEPDKRRTVRSEVTRLIFHLVQMAVRSVLSISILNLLSRISKVTFFQYIFQTTGWSWNARGKTGAVKLGNHVKRNGVGSLMNDSAGGLCIHSKSKTSVAVRTSKQI